jgi:hypothetical protein
MSHRQSVYSKQGVASTDSGVCESRLLNLCGRPNLRRSQEMWKTKRYLRLAALRDPWLKGWRSRGWVE